MDGRRKPVNVFDLDVDHPPSSIGQGAPAARLTSDKRHNAMTRLASNNVVPSPPVRVRAAAGTEGSDEADSQEQDASSPPVLPLSLVLVAALNMLGSCVEYQKSTLSKQKRRVRD